MRGQLSLEFLLSMLATLVLVSAMAGAILSQREAVGLRAAELGEITSAESAARAVEAGMRGGGSISAGPLGLGYRIEGGAFHHMSDGKAVEIRGVFFADPDEPV